MKRAFAIVLGLVVVAGFAFGAFLFLPHGAATLERPGNMPEGHALIERGKYLTAAADCVACHTLPGGKPYAGGLPFHLPFGTIYAPNITPDKETGIGDWNDADFVRAMHHGIAKDGTDLYPAFPYDNYAQITTADVLAIKAYLFSLPPVKAHVPNNTLHFPYNIRNAVRVWNILFVPNDRLPDGTDTDPVARGRYLVEALGHCGQCHTPRNALYARDKGRKFEGATTEGWRAYNITSDKRDGIGAWSDDELAAYLSCGHAAQRGSASGNMAEAVSYSLSHLSQQDIRAMVAYLRTIPPRQGNDPPIDLKPPATEARSAYAPGKGDDTTKPLGLALFEQNCASCHGFNGKGLQTAKADLVGARTVNDPRGTNLLQVLLHGVTLETPDGTTHMPSFAKAYTDPELAALANYVLTQFGGQNASVTPDDVTNARKASMPENSRS